MTRPDRLLLVLALCLAGAPSAAPQEPPGPDGPPLTVPEGFTVERVAGPPQVERPIMASFDDRGRLYVTDSAGVNLRGSELLKDPPHRIRLLRDTQGNGRFDSSSVFADRLVFPQGLLWHEGAVYTTSPPSFWKLECTKGDDVCDRRTELVKGLANTGVADDAHGACLGPDGRIYFLPGRMAHALAYPDGTPIRKATGPWLVRMKPDGTQVEIVSGCQGNPVEVDWTPEGDFFISGTFWAPDSFGGGLRDALIHGVEGGEYPVRDRVYSDRKRTGDFLPVLVPMVATAPSGMMIYRSAGLGKEYTGNLFCTYFNTHKVQRHILEREGSTWRAKTEDFVTSTHPDFHPTDVLEDADGSILVVDTGGWFRIGCPTSQIAKPQVLGGIYRIRRKDMPKVEDPRGLRADWTHPVALLDDPRFAVRERAIQEAAKQGVTRLKEALLSPSPRARLSAVWALCRIDGPEARSIAIAALSDPDPGVRQAAIISAGLHREPAALARLRQMVTSDLPQIRRESATALGRIGDRQAVSSLLDSIRAGADRFLEHAIIFALIRLGDRDAMRVALKEPGAAARRAALVALDQMDGGELTQDQVTPLLDPVDVPLQQAALRVILSRPSWAKEILGLAGQWLAEPALDEGRQETLRGIIVSFAAHPSFQDLLARSLRDPGTPGPTRVLILESMARSPLEHLPATWLAEARWSLDSPDEKVVRQAVATLRASGIGEFDEALLGLSRDEARSIELRSESLAASTSRLARLDPGLLGFLLGCLEKDKAPLTRVTAAEALGRSPLDDVQLERLTRAIPGVGPLEMPRLIGVFERSKNAGVGRKLVVALETSPGLQSLSGEGLRKALRNFPEEVRTRAEPILKKLEVDTAAMKARLDELAPVLSGGEVGHGREVFFGKKAGCTACHTVAGSGGKVGPDLSKIGSIRAGRDLLESIVFPSASFARGYEPFLLRTRDGAIYDGLIVRETAEAIVMFTSERIEKRIPRSSIEEIRQGKVSVMPQGLDAQLTRDELRDLIAYLLSLR